jgi:DNA-directed RNA polymerase subunit RPC12/RpoP
MIIATYTCGYCKKEFKVEFFNEEEIPERNIGCTHCRIAGEKVRLKYFTRELMKPFNADSITLNNFEGIFKCRKKPIVIHALQMNFPEGFDVTSKEGIETGQRGDYLMFGIHGEKYICAKEIFEESYEKVEDIPTTREKEDV